MRDHAQQRLDIRFTTSGDVTQQHVHRAQEVIERVLSHASEPVLYSRVTLATLADPALPRPALASIRVDFNGRPINAHAAAPTVPEAVALAGDRLRIRLDRASRDWQARRGQVHAGRPDTDR